MRQARPEITRHRPTGPPGLVPPGGPLAACCQALVPSAADGPWRAITPGLTGPRGDCALRAGAYARANRRGNRSLDRWAVAAETLRELVPTDGGSDLGYPLTARNDFATQTYVLRATVCSARPAASFLRSTDSGGVRTPLDETLNPDQCCDRMRVLSGG
jgi:hypothetical protein